ncbi:MAG: MBL fold metallo-hydrolase [Clostridiales bacterium]|nr:MBL fold metallo-hydrolase [Clostridiales bacterium]
MKNRLKQLFLVAIVVAFLFTATSCNLKVFTGSPLPTVTIATPKPANANPFEGELQAYFLDVGQGDSILLISPNDKTMLIDAGTSKSYKTIQSKLEELKIEKLDIVIATHPHADHIGSMTSVIENYEIESFYLPECDTDTKTYTNMMNALDEKEIEYEYLYANMDLAWDDTVKIQVLSPIEGVNYGSITNNYSIMLHFAYGSSSLLLSGDGEKKAEENVLENFEDIEADVLKLGHHGSDTASTREFVLAVNPSLAIISLGEDNKYGHPHKTTLDLLEELNKMILRTDTSGTIHVIFNGIEYVIVEPVQDGKS